MKKKVLLICTGNCCRSPMAEGIWRYLGGKEWDVYSAGTSPTGYIHPQTIECMAGQGIDISGQTSKAIADLGEDYFDIAITLCPRARQKLPVLPATEILHWPISDPFLFQGSDKDRIQAFKETYDELAAKIGGYLQTGK